MNYIKINKYNIVIGGGSCQDEAVDNIPLLDDERLIQNFEFPGYDSIWKFEDNNLVNTNQPLHPPYKGMSWSNSLLLWVDTRTAESEWLEVKLKRNQKLLESDWTQLPDVPLQTKELWVTYRQQLRDITLQPDPFNIIWPVPPQ